VIYYFVHASVNVTDPKHTNEVGRGFNEAMDGCDGKQRFEIKSSKILKQSSESMHVNI
jgi:hypothetical protein